MKSKKKMKEELPNILKKHVRRKQNNESRKKVRNFCKLTRVKHLDERNKKKLEKSNHFFAKLRKGKFLQIY